MLFVREAFLCKIDSKKDHENGFFDGPRILHFLTSPQRLPSPAANIDTSSIAPRLTYRSTFAIA